MIKKGDFVEIDFVGKLKETGEIFDLTKKNTAEKEKIANKSADYSPKIVCVGNGDVVRGLDESLIGKDAGKKYRIDIDVENGFGRKNAKLIKMVPMSAFKQENMKPFPGLQVNIDGHYGTIRTVSGGRVLVDFNHPLSGRELTYEVEVRRIVVDDTEKIKSVMKNLIRRDVDCRVTDGNAVINLEIPAEFQKMLSEGIKKLIKTIKNIEFKKEDEKKLPEKTEVTTQK
ncbi:MAG: FKBP-type peptidyl-prolyl cis-trans isomerase [Nanoarchaeota archaeon]|nr:FKBP-type peptidyl-prolyl cis-trans isomerase [Nanoarchaeota archaeon]